MSLVTDQVRQLDAYLDRLPVLSEVSSETSDSDEHPQDDNQQHGHHLRNFTVTNDTDAARVDNLLGIVRSLSTTNSSNPLLTTDLIKHHLLMSGITSSELRASRTNRTQYEDEIEWLVVSKAAIQLHGAVLNTLLDQIIPLNDDIWYWKGVLNSYTYSSLYAVQTSPWRFAAWSVDIYNDSINRLRTSTVSGNAEHLVSTAQSGLAQQWRQFYGIVRETIRERSFSNVQRKFLSPVAFCRADARRKQGQLRRIREITATGLGVLMSEGLQFTQEDEKTNVFDANDLKGTVERSVALMDMVLREVCHPGASISDFEEKVFAGVEADPELSVHTGDVDALDRPLVLGRRLLALIDNVLPEHQKTMTALVKESGRPHPIVRYWLPGAIGLVSSTTVLRILLNRKADIINWIQDFGVTVRDFWFNWVVEPTQKVIQTIRHDKTSEIAIMSRDSLKADRESLERMVVDFSIDKPHFAGVEGSALSAAQISEIRTKVAEGDVTPVLKAFEQDLRSPFTGAVRGDLIRSLLIQVQKTKVDLEVAMTGIDSLLKSQELVFGFVGLTPGVLVSIGTFRYMHSLFGGRSGQKRTKTAVQATRALRNIDRVLSDARPSEDNTLLSYKHHGFLLCEAHVLRNLAVKLMPRDIADEFLEDLSDLEKMKAISVQDKASARLTGPHYMRWLQ